MTLTVSIGQAQELNGRAGGLQATHQALNRLGTGSPSFGLVIASHQYQAREVVSGVSSLLGDTPMIGFSSSAGLTSSGLYPNSVIVALLGEDVVAETSLVARLRSKWAGDRRPTVQAGSRTGGYTSPAFLRRWL